MLLFQINSSTQYLYSRTAPPGDLLGRGLEIVVPGSLTGQAPQKHSFGFDKVRLGFHTATCCLPPCKISGMRTHSCLLTTQTAD